MKFHVPAWPGLLAAALVVAADQGTKLVVAHYRDHHLVRDFHWSGLHLRSSEARSGYSDFASGKNRLSRQTLRRHEQHKYDRPVTHNKSSSY